MTTLFHRIQPAKKFRITLTCIAQFLKIPKHLIVRVECWAYIIFVHRGDKGGQFISYRQLRQWLNAVACQIDRKSTRLNSSHANISYAVFCLKKKNYHRNSPA